MTLTKGKKSHKFTCKVMKNAQKYFDTNEIFSIYFGFNTS